MKLDDKLNRLCDFKGCTDPSTQRTRWCKRHGQVDRVRRHRAAAKITLAVEVQDVIDEETLDEFRHWFHADFNRRAGLVRVDDPDVAWCLESDQQRAHGGRARHRDIERVA